MGPQAGQIIRRKIEALGLRVHTSARTTGLIGTDQPSGEHVIAWVDLGKKFLRTFSRTASTGWKLRSPLERYAYLGRGALTAKFAQGKKLL